MKRTIRFTAIIMVLVLALGTFAACSSLKPLSKQIVGKWVDTSALNSGYEFMEDGTCKVTFAKFTIPIINQEFNGTVDGLYSTSKSEDGKELITISYTVLLQSIQKTYEYGISDGILTLTDTENGNKTLLKHGEVPTEANS